MKLYRNWIINEVARAGEHTNERTYVRTYVLTYIRTGQTLYPLHNFVVRGDKKPVLLHKLIRIFNFHFIDFLEPVHCSSEQKIERGHLLECSTVTMLIFLTPYCLLLVYIHMDECGLTEHVFLMVNYIFSTVLTHTIPTACSVSFHITPIKHTAGIAFYKKECYSEAEEQPISHCQNNVVFR